MSFKHKLPKIKIMLFGLLAVLIIFMGYVVYVDVGNTTKISVPQTASHGFPYRAPNNPTNFPLVTNYSIVIPNAYGEWFLNKAEINFAFIAPTLGLQTEENGTISNYWVTSLPCTFSTVSANTSSIAMVLPPVFNGTTIDVKVDVYQWNGINPQPTLVGSNEWNITEYAYA